MPNRSIRESTLTSSSLATLSHGAERFFFRLTLVADDFGRFEADPMVLLARCFPAMLDKVRGSDIARWWLELGQAELVAGYCVGGKPYAYFVTWEKHQTKRAMHSKHPDPMSADACRHLSADACICSREARSENREAKLPRSEKSGNRATAPVATAPTSPAIAFQIPASVSEALKRTRILGQIARFRDPSWWQAQLRANPGVDLGAEVLKAEAWIASNPSRAPRKAFERFLHTWLARADRETSNG